jgi:hypothetical protein
MLANASTGNSPVGGTFLYPCPEGRGFTKDVVMMHQRQRTWWWLGMIIGLLFTVFGLLATPVWGAILYVDKDNGCPGSGTTGSPYCSLANGIAALAAGDTLRIRDSAAPYDETVIMTTSGTSGSPIIIEPDVGHNPTLRYTGNDAGTAVIELRKNSYVTIQNLTFDGVGVQTSRYAILIRTAVGTCSDGIDVFGLRILGNTIKNWGGNATQVNTAANRGAFTIDGGFCPGGTPGLAQGVVISGNTFDSNRQTHVQLLHASGTIIENNTFIHAMCGRDVDTARNTMGVKVGDAADNQGSGTIIRNNTFRDWESQADCGIANAGGGAYDSLPAIWCDVGPWNSQVYNNLIHHINAGGSGDGTTNHESQGIFVEAGCAGWKVYNNVIHHIGGAGIRQSQRRGSSGYPANEYYQNTVYAIGQHGFELEGLSDSAGASIIKNNIVMDAGTAQIYINPSEAIHTIDYNLYYDSTGSKIGQWAGGVTNFATWKTNCNCDSHSVNANPVFVTAGATPDLQLQTSSPAKDAGVTIGSVTTDILGMTRPQGSAYDMGAYEFVVGGGSPDITSNLALWWKFNDVIGPDAADSSSGGYPGTLSGSTVPTWTTGCQLAGCLTFNGSTAYVGTTGAPNIVTGGANTVFTLSAWVRLPTSPPPANAAFLSNGVSGGTSQYYLGYNSAGKIVLFYSADPTFATYRYGASTTAGAIPANTWVHVVWVNSADSDVGQTVYVNGSPHALTYVSPGAATVPSTGFGTTAVGRDGSNAAEYWPGLVDDVRIYTRALLSTDVTALWQYTEAGGGATVPVLIRLVR